MAHKYSIVYCNNIIATGTSKEVRELLGVSGSAFYSAVRRNTLINKLFRIIRSDSDIRPINMPLYTSNWEINSAYSNSGVATIKEMEEYIRITQHEME